MTEGKGRALAPFTPSAPLTDQAVRSTGSVPALNSSSHWWVWNGSALAGSGKNSTSLIRTCARKVQARKNSNIHFPMGALQLFVLGWNCTTSLAKDERRMPGHPIEDRLAAGHGEQPFQRVFYKLRAAAVE